MSGNCWKRFQGRSSKVKDVAIRNELLCWRLHFEGLASRHTCCICIWLLQKHVGSGTTETSSMLQRLRALEREKAALMEENKNQRRRFERCLGDVTSHVIDVMLAQKVSKHTAFIIIIIHEFHRDASLETKLQGCFVLHYCCNVNAAVADSLHCRMICGTVPSSVHA